MRLGCCDDFVLTSVSDSFAVNIFIDNFSHMTVIRKWNAIRRGIFDTPLRHSVVDVFLG